MGRTPNECYCSPRFCVGRPLQSKQDLLRTPAVSPRPTSTRNSIATSFKALVLLFHHQPTPWSAPIRTYSNPAPFLISFRSGTTVPLRMGLLPTSTLRRTPRTNISVHCRLLDRSP